MEKMVTVRCGNPYFNGRMHGVKFEQTTGGAIGIATATKAKKIEAEENFSVEWKKGQMTPAADAPTIEDVNGIGPVTAEKLATAGITTLEELKATSTAAIAEATGESEKAALDWGVQAEEILARFAEQTDTTE